jgi:hypothetical protein
MKRLALALMVLAAASGCGRTPTETDVAHQVTSWCDEHGNRVYVRGTDINHALFVLGADPTCAKEVPRGDG